MLGNNPSKKSELREYSHFHNKLMLMPVIVVAAERVFQDILRDAAELTVFGMYSGYVDQKVVRFSLIYLSLASTPSKWYETYQFDCLLSLS